MPGRRTPLVTNQIYHVLNKGISSQLTFKGLKEFNRAKELIRYYQNITIPLRYSQFKTFSYERKNRILKNLSNKKNWWVEIICFCFMPNHFHFLLRQLKENGISKFISQFSNSYTRYFNEKNKRKGPLFQGKFKAIRIVNNEQLLHISRYIHLNPYSSYVVKELKDLEDYQYSSLSEYLNSSKTNFCNKKIILNQFRYPKLYKKFVFDQADYQRKLDRIKHLTLDE